MLRAMKRKEEKKAQAQAPAPYLAGLDFLKVSLHMDWDAEWFMKTLHDFKEEFQEEELNPNAEAKERSLILDGGIKFNMSAKGTSNYPYLLSCGDIRLLFSNHQADSQFPNCRIEIGSMSCWNPGFQQLFDKIVRWLRCWGGTIRKQLPSEFHMAVDLLDVDFNQTGFDNIRRWVTKANQYNIHGEYRTPNYIAFGKGQFMLRIYNKTGELKEGSKKESFFHALWAEHVQALPPKKVTRIEFQIRRTKIKELQIKTVGELAKKLNSIWNYCVNKWCRFCATDISEEDRKNNNQQRYTTAFIWEFVRSIRFNGAKVYKIKFHKVKCVNVEALQKQAAGCLLAICAAKGMEPDDYERHIVSSFGMIDEQIRQNYKGDSAEYIRKIETKYNAAHLTV
ncbi:MAG: hypothetical protein D3923_00085 [Candidatus Electrothrix sp. AR3]|nr:hypothetical protein [Candidatus Electrothrix sp. AR3]